MDLGCGGEATRDAQGCGGGPSPLGLLERDIMCRVVHVRGIGWVAQGEHFQCKVEALTMFDQVRPTIGCITRCKLMHDYFSNLIHACYVGQHH